MLQCCQTPNEHMLDKKHYRSKTKSAFSVQYKCTDFFSEWYYGGSSHCGNFTEEKHFYVLHISIFHVSYEPSVTGKCRDTSLKMHACIRTSTLFNWKIRDIYWPWNTLQHELTQNQHLGVAFIWTLWTGCDLKIQHFLAVCIWEYYRDRSPNPS